MIKKRKEVLIMPSNIDTKQEDKTRKSKIRFIAGCWGATIILWTFIILSQSGNIPVVTTIFKNAPPDIQEYFSRNQAARKAIRRIMGQKKEFNWDKIAN